MTKAEKVIDSRWQHKSRGGNKYPVDYGDIWRVGEITIGCGDLEHHSLDALLAHCPTPPAWTYTDPPWNNGLAKAFRTKAAISPPTVDYRDLIRQVARECPSPLWIEMGTSTHEEFLRSMHQMRAETDLHHIATIDTEYNHGALCHLHLFDHPGRKKPPKPKIRMTGLDVPRWVMGIETGCVIDPMCGMGMTLVAAAEAGYPAIGNELHPMRVSAALHVVAQVTGLPAQRIAKRALPHAAL